MPKSMKTVFSALKEISSLVGEVDTETLKKKKRFYLFIFRERGRWGERKGEKHQCVVASCTSPAGDSACNPGTCPDWESIQQPFGLQAGTQSTEPHQPGHRNTFKYNLVTY